MGKSVIAFLTLWLLTTVSITGFRSLKGCEKLSLTKTVAYGALCATIALSILTAFVILF